MKKVIVISLLGALAIGALIASNYFSRPKVDPLDKPLATWLEQEAMPKSQQRHEYLMRCVGDLGVASPSEHDVNACYMKAKAEYRTIPFEAYMPRDEK